MTPSSLIDNEIYSALRPDRPIKIVLIEPNLWLGFLLQLDIPGKSDQLIKIGYLDRLATVKKYLKKTASSQNYFDEFPFYIKVNPYIQGVRVILYPVIP